MKDKLITVVLMVIVAALIIAGFLKIREDSARKVSTELTEVQRILNKDLETSYPANAREVVKFYSRILKAYYATPLSDEELTGLAEQARILFDTELLKRNPFDDYMADLKLEVEDYLKNGRTIINTDVQSFSDIEFIKKGEYNTATVVAYYLIRDKESSTGSYYKYYLRQDEEGKWRILFWELTDDRL